MIIIDIIFRKSYWKFGKFPNQIKINLVIYNIEHISKYIYSRIEWEYLNIYDCPEQK